MGRKILIVGGVAGGASAAARLRRLSETDEIIMFERGPHVSFSNCCLPYHLSGMISEASKLVLMCPDKFMKQYRIEARVNNEVLSIDRNAKKVTIKNTVSGEEYTENYDKLILSPGAKAIVPNIKGLDKQNIFTVRNVVDIDKLNKEVKKDKNQKISVIGGGFVGIEVAENLIEAGYEVSLIEAEKQVLGQFDYDMVQIIHRELHDKGLNLVLNDRVVELEEKAVVLASGAKVEADIVVFAIGVKPETDLAEACGLEIGKTGAIKVDQNYLTNDKDIYAVGDAIEVYNPLMQKMIKLPLAGPAQKQARGVADHINGKAIINKGFIGSSVIKVFDYNGASTGLSEECIKKTGMEIEYDHVKIIPGDMVGLMPNCKPAHFKLIFEKPTGRILGAQAIGQGNVDKRIDVIATAIKFGATLDDLRDLELTYAPPFGTAKDIVNFGGYIGSNVLCGSYEQVHVSKVRELVEQGEVIIDVREVNEYELSHVNGAINIPLSQFRERINEIPKDKKVYIHCRSGQRSYNAVLILNNLGYTNAYNISGGFMGISFYEYFNDVKLKREKIVTDYNFN